MASVLVVGPPGAEPEALAAALVRAGIAGVVCADAVPPDAELVLVALDMSVDIGIEETNILSAIVAAKCPCALIACCVDRHRQWPAVLDRARRVLDPASELAMFAVAADTDGGIADVAEWLTGSQTPQSVPSVEPVGEPTPVNALEAAGSRRSPQDIGPRRSTRLAGLRAGLAAARASALTAARESNQALAVCADHACADLARRDAPALTSWLIESVSALDRASTEALDEALAQIRGAVTLGLPLGPAAAPVDTELPPPARPIQPRLRADDAVVLLLGLSAGFGTGRLLLAPMANVTGPDWLGSLVTAVLGLSIAAWIVAVRRTAAVRTSMRKWSADTLALSRTALEHRLLARVTASEASLIGELGHNGQSVRTSTDLSRRGEQWTMTG